MELAKLSEANPWWVTKKVPDALKGQPRKAYQLLLKSIDIEEATIITGVRRSGKSTLMYQMIDKLLKKDAPPEQILYANLEDPKLANNSLSEIYKTYREGVNPDRKAYVFLDEIHKKKGWEQWIRHQYDLHADCKFIISGSCSYLLKKEYSTLLTGRNLSFEVFPLSFKEFLSFKGVKLDYNALRRGMVLEKHRYQILKSLNEYLTHGGFPAIFFREEPFKTKILAQYFDDILYKDIIDRYELNAKKIRDLALYLMTNFTGAVSLRSLRNSLGLSYESINDYLSYYKEAFLFFILDHFSYSMKEQKTNPSKIYCIDDGLRNAVSFKFSRDEGRLAENIVFIETQRRGEDVYYWKSPKHKEVDFIIKNTDQSLTALNVSYTDEINEREIQSLKEFKDRFRNTNELIVLTKDTEKTEEGVRFIPLWTWLLKGEKTW